MKHRNLGKRGLTLAALLMMTAATARAGSANVQAAATIHPPLKMQALENLAFGTIAPDVSGSGNVTIDANSDKSTTCASNLDCMEGGDRAKILISGRSSQAVQVTASESITLTSAEGDTMQVSGFTFAGEGYSNGVAYINSNGMLELGVGATLNVGKDQPVGNYTGVFRVTMTYQ